MSTPITPLRAPALADLQNALQIAACYGDKDVSDSDAKQALGRIRGLIATALAKLAEPNGAALLAAVTMLRPVANGAWRGNENDDRYARDTAAVIIRAALTGETGEPGFVKQLPCPDCDGSGMVLNQACGSCKGTGLPL